MNINRAFDFITENNIKPEEVFILVDKIKGLDLENEENIRVVIREVARLANKPIDSVKENRIVKEIMKNGVNDNLFAMIE